MYSGKNSLFFWRTLLGMISSASAIKSALSLYINASISSFTFSYDAETSAIMKFKKIKDENITAIIQTIQNITFYDNKFSPSIKVKSKSPRDNLKVVRRPPVKNPTF